jgi:hypothetical protein
MSSAERSSLSYLFPCSFARQTEQWKMRQKWKETAYREFHSVFGESTGKELKTSDSHNDNNNDEENHDLDAIRESKKFNHGEVPFDRKQKTNEKIGNHDYDASKTSKKQKLGKPHFQKSTSKFISYIRNMPFGRESGKRDSAVSELAQLASKSDLTAGEVRSLFNASVK